MTRLAITDHATMRLAQRAISCRDVDLVLAIGTEVGDGYLVRDQDCEHTLRALRELRERVERLRGARLVCVGGKLLTAYKASMKQRKRLIRRR
jgi:hypothetical protein